MEYIEIPEHLSLNILFEKFGKDAVNYYSNRLAERERDPLRRSLRGLRRYVR